MGTRRQAILFAVESVACSEAEDVVLAGNRFGEFLNPELGGFKAGQTYRLRIININPENPPIDVSLKSER